MANSCADASRAWLINHKKTHRNYCEEGLNLRRKRLRRRVAAAHRLERPDIAAPDQVWSMDFVDDERFNGRRIRALTVVDNFNRQSLAIDVDWGGGCRNHDAFTVAITTP